MVQETVPFNRRIYAVLQPQDADGMVLLKLSLTPPSYTDPAAVLLFRGVLPMGTDITLELVSDPSKDAELTGPPGADVTDAQVAVAVSTYLTAHPPSAGKDGTAPTVAVGKVTALAAGAAATVVNSGTASAIVLDIGIPAGAPGSPAAATPLATATPAALGATASIGTSSKAAREDHAHVLPSGLAVALGSITFGETATIAIQAGVRQLTVAAAGVKAGDAIVLAPATALPAGYLLGRAIASADGQLQIALSVPLITIGTKYLITARVLRLG